MMVNIELLTKPIEQLNGKSLVDFPRDKKAVQTKTNPDSHHGSYITVGHRRFNYSCVAATRVGGHTGRNEAGPCGHIGTLEDTSWRDAEAACTLCGVAGRWNVPHEFFYTEVNSETI